MKVGSPTSIHQKGRMFWGQCPGRFVKVTVSNSGKSSGTLTPEQKPLFVARSWAAMFHPRLSSLCFRPNSPSGRRLTFLAPCCHDEPHLKNRNHRRGARKIATTGDLGEPIKPGNLGDSSLIRSRDSHFAFFEAAQRGGLICF